MVFAGILEEIAAERGFDCIIVPRGRDLPAMVRSHAPDAITLDIQLPDMDGWTLLDRITSDREMRHLPVHLITVVDDEERLRGRGVDYSGKPVSRERLVEAFDALAARTRRAGRRLLLVRPRAQAVKDIRPLLAAMPSLVVQEETAARAAAALREPADGVLLVAPVLDDAAMRFLDELADGREVPPLVVAVAEPPSEPARALLDRLGARVLSFDQPNALGCLVDMLADALKLRWGDLPAELRQMGASVRAADGLLSEQAVLVIDDDIRNIFSMTALLEDHGIEVLSAESGPAGLALLEQRPDVAAVLVDIMMPGMDGYEVMARIRETPKLADLPLVAVTAKAMPEDRERCFRAGASDYLAKPVEQEDLIAVLRTWAKRRRPEPART